MALPTIAVLDKDSAPVTINRIASGRQAAADSQAVVIATEDLSALSAGPRAISATQFARPANTTAYSVGDLVADSATAGSVTAVAIPSAVRAAGECIRIERVTLKKSGTSLTNANFRVYICSAFPTLSVGDNAIFNTAGALGISNMDAVLGYFDLTMDRSATAGARGSGTPSLGAALTAKPASGTTLYALIEATTAYTPTSGETWDLTIEGQWS